MNRAVIRAVAVLAVIAAVVVVPVVAQSAPAQAPAFTLELFNGQTLKLADLKGKHVALFFWAEW
jgi:cytochrome oxidase Cu insertion factor (SCO1/SenC/PrrC family)